MNTISPPACTSFSGSEITSRHAAVNPRLKLTLTQDGVASSYIFKTHCQLTVPLERFRSQTPHHANVSVAESESIPRGTVDSSGEASSKEASILLWSTHRGALCTVFSTPPSPREGAQTPFKHARVLGYYFPFPYKQSVVRKLPGSYGRSSPNSDIIGRIATNRCLDAMIHYSQCTSTNVLRDQNDLAVYETPRSACRSEAYGGEVSAVSRRTQRRSSNISLSALAFPFSVFLHTSLASLFDHSAICDCLIHRFPYLLEHSSSFCISLQSTRFTRPINHW
jgi:hypothetical protein